MKKFSYFFVLLVCNIAESTEVNMSISRSGSFLVLPSCVRLPPVHLSNGVWLPSEEAVLLERDLLLQRKTPQRSCQPASVQWAWTPATCHLKLFNSAQFCKLLTIIKKPRRFHGGVLVVGDSLSSQFVATLLALSGGIVNWTNVRNLTKHCDETKLL